MWIAAGWDAAFHVLDTKRHSCGLLISRGLCAQTTCYIWPFLSLFTTSFTQLRKVNKHLTRCVPVKAHCHLFYKSSELGICLNMPLSNSESLIYLSAPPVFCLILLSKLRKLEPCPSYWSWAASLHNHDQYFLYILCIQYGCPGVRYTWRNVTLWCTLLTVKILINSGISIFTSLKCSFFMKADVIMSFLL